jgi:hypothetical protein
MATPNTSVTDFSIKLQADNSSHIKSTQIKSIGSALCVWLAGWLAGMGQNVKKVADVDVIDSPTLKGRLPCLAPLAYPIADSGGTC